MAHSLLGFQRKSLDYLANLQKELVSNDVKLGRDSSSMFWNFGTTNAASRVVRMTCELLGPNGDEKNGIRGRWMADCMQNNIQSLIGKFLWACV